MPNSKKTGKPTEAETVHNIPQVGTEKDPDELVHEPHEITPSESQEQDIDDLLHGQPSSPPTGDLGERDPDDLVHEQDEGAE